MVDSGRGFMDFKSNYSDRYDSSFQFHIEDILIRNENISFNLREAIQIIHVKSGRIYYTNSPQLKSISDCSLMVIPQYCDSNIRAARNSDIMRMTFSPPFLKDIESMVSQQKTRDFPDMSELFSSDKISVQNLNRESNLIIHEIFFEIFKEYSRKNPGYQLMIRAKFVEFLLLLNRLNAEKNAQGISKNKQQVIEKILKYIQENCDTEFRLEEMALQCNMNPSYFCRIFREQAGVPVFQYINQVRIQKACSLLKRTNISIIEIAFSVGYQNLSFFNRCFKRIMRMSPRQYRQMIRK